MPYGNISRALNNEGNMSGTLTIQPTAGSGVSDVLVNSESVVTDHKAYVNIEVEQTVTEGKKIASVIVNGNNTDILIPEIKIYDEASGDLITIDDAMEAPLEECKVTIEPQQEGSGEPSPTNIRPISGWDEVKVTRAGKNLFDTSTVTNNKIPNTDGMEMISSYGRFTSDYIEVNEEQTYYLSNVIKSASWSCAWFYDENKNFISRAGIPSSGNLSSGAVTIPQSANYMRIVGLLNSKNDVQVEDGNIGSAIEPYNGTTYTIQLGSTCYGGELDVKRGVLKVTDGYIASYNGETLPSTWISDRDVYAPNTSPTTGAEVAYKLATSQEIQLTPTEVTLLRGINNLWSDGEMYVKWRVDVEMLLQSIVDNR